MKWMSSSKLIPVVKNPEKKFKYHKPYWNEHLTALRQKMRNKENEYNYTNIIEFTLNNYITTLKTAKKYLVKNSGKPREIITEDSVSI